MPKSNNVFNKKIFSLLLTYAKGSRSTRSFAKDCGISYVQLHKLELCAQENPPGLKLITKLAENSENGIDLEDFMFAAGINASTNSKPQKARRKTFDIQNMYDKLSAGQQKTVYDFVDYLLNYKG